MEYLSKTTGEHKQTEKKQGRKLKFDLNDAKMISQNQFSEINLFTFCYTESISRTDWNVFMIENELLQEIGWNIFIETKYIIV